MRMTWEKKEENTQGGIKENGIEKCSKKVFQKKDVNRMKRRDFFKVKISQEMNEN